MVGITNVNPLLLNLEYWKQDLGHYHQVHKIFADLSLNYEQTVTSIGPTKLDGGQIDHFK